MAERKTAVSCSVFDIAAGKATAEQHGSIAANNDQKVQEEEEIDPLDAFMAGLDQEIKQTKPKPAHRIEPDEDEDPLDIYMKQLADKPDADEREELDEDEERERRTRDDNVPLLPALDHANIPYAHFRRQLLHVHPDVASMTQQQINATRDKLGVQVHGTGEIASPAMSFGHLGIGDKLVEAASECGFERPTPIQAQAVPIALSGRDLIGVASTGSGKTAAFIWPMLLHLQAQSGLPVARGAGPIALILAPTRELATQIYTETRKYLKAFQKRAPKDKRWRVVPVFGGMNSYEQKQALALGCEIVVATPGRLLDHLRKKNLSCELVTQVVIDEADRLLAMGFEGQARAILGQVRPDRHSMLFSATFKRRVESLARSLLSQPVRVSTGRIGAASTSVAQHLVMLERSEQRLGWLLSRLPSFMGRGQTLIFAGTRQACDDLAEAISTEERLETGVLHGAKTQSERLEIMQRFKSGDLRIVVASDVASRGLDVSQLATVVNFEIARDVDAHVHRIGRVGRAGQQAAGNAFTLLAADLQRANTRALPNILRCIQDAGHAVPDPALALSRRLWPNETAHAFRIGVGGGAAGPSSTERRGRGNGAARKHGRSAASSSNAISSSSSSSSPASLRMSFQNSFVRASSGGIARRPPPAEQAAPTPRKRSRWDT